MLNLKSEAWAGESPPGPLRFPAPLLFSLLGDREKEASWKWKTPEQEFGLSVPCECVHFKDKTNNLQMLHPHLILIPHVLCAELLYFYITLLWPAPSTRIFLSIQLQEVRGHLVFDGSKAAVQGIQIVTIFRIKRDMRLGVIGVTMVGHNVVVMNNMTKG